MNAITQIAAPITQFTIEAWLHGRDFLLPAIALLRGTHTEEDVVASLLAGRMRLWLGREFAAVTEIIQQPRIKEMNVFIAGGNMDALVAMKDAFENHGREMGCDRVTIRGREGWRKVHPEYDLVGIIICKDL